MSFSFALIFLELNFTRKDMRMNDLEIAELIKKDTDVVIKYMNAVGLCEVFVEYKTYPSPEMIVVRDGKLGSKYAIRREGEPSQWSNPYSRFGCKCMYAGDQEDYNWTINGRSIRVILERVRDDIVKNRVNKYYCELDNPCCNF
jgi:hypothetical protein